MDMWVWVGAILLILVCVLLAGSYSGRDAERFRRDLEARNPNHARRPPDDWQAP
jgi:hypothetical protein